MSYRVFNPGITQRIKLTRRYAGPLFKEIKHKHKTPLAQFLATLRKEQEVLRNSNARSVMDMELYVYADYFRWMDEGRQCLIFETTELADFLKRTKFDNVDINGLEFPFSSVNVAVPHNFKVRGHNISGLLITTQDCFNGVTETLEHFLNNHAKITHLHIVPSPMVSNHLGEKTITLNYVVDDERNVVGHQVNSRLVISENLMKPALTMGDKEFIDYLRHELEPLSANPLSDEEMLVQKDLMHLILGMFIYIQAFGFDEVVKPGFPDNVTPVKLKLEKHDLRCTKYRLTNQFKHQERQSPDEHLRGPFFRTLRHEKYYQGEHQHKARGSRIRYVQGTYVKGRGTVDTLVDKTDKTQLT